MTIESALITGLEGGVDYAVWMTYSNKGGYAPNSTVLRLITRNGEFCECIFIRVFSVILLGVLGCFLFSFFLGGVVLFLFSFVLFLIHY